MDAVSVYILIFILALLGVFLGLVFLRKQKKRRMSSLASIAFSLVVLSIVFEDRFISYSFIGAGVILAIVDIVRNKR